MNYIRRYFGDIHPYRWMALSVWVVIFTALTFYALQQNRTAINELQDTKANLVQLKHTSNNLRHTDCVLRSTLVTARAARFTAAAHEKGQLRRADLRAAHSYDNLINAFNGSCRRAK